MFKVLIVLYIILNINNFCNEYKEYNQEIKKNLIDINKNQIMHKEDEKTNIVDEVYYKLEDTIENTRMSLNNTFNKFLVPKFFKRDMKIDLKISDDLNEVSFNYIYNPEYYKNTKFILTLKDEVILKYKYSKKIENIPFFKPILNSPII